jgi:hypothetical protein
MAIQVLLLLAIQHLASPIQAVLLLLLQERLHLQQEVWLVKGVYQVS